MINLASRKIIDVFPLGAICKNGKGNDLSEMNDMTHAGAVAFKNVKPRISSGLLQRALEYVKPFNGLIVVEAFANDLEEMALIHEGKVSTSLGMRGMPSVWESTSIERYLNALEYTGSRMHILNISCAESVKLVRQAKRKGLAVTCSTNPLYLIFTDENLSDFNTQLKIDPPLRERKDQQALIKALKDGTIDCLHSNHIPVESEAKQVTFQQAKFGAINLETAFSLSFMALHSHLSVQQIIELWNSNPRTIFSIDEPVIEKGAKACMVLIDQKKKYTYTYDSIVSKSKNSPLIDMELVGKPVAVFNNNGSFINKS